MKPEPMNISNAIEVMKVLAPYAKRMSRADDGFGMIRALTNGLAADHMEENLGRLIALMRAKKYEEVVAEYEEHRSVEKAFVDLVECFDVNPIPDLVNAGFGFGLIAQPWSNE